ncbi:putative bifunctional diguanylate cyclase/phosphodiesterase [Allomesorhizobium alhagi]|uniref:putative bifunctional diguanylate cyclase/phosphodiesterase n=1 Tax=Allomesorhizobium alhagi TaxID=475067 RepID=UPI001FCB4994|nr:EAL domain-containing protein [Mesorhizobium alhagi]
MELIRHSILYAGKQHQVLAVRDIRGRKRAEEEIHFLAHHDPLTKLPNRTSFNEKLEAEFTIHRGADRCLAVLFLDLDRFKEINDLFGHLVGDAVLQCVAEKIRGVLKPGQMVARLGGDEFAVIVPGLPSAGYATRIAEAILDAFNDTGANLPAGVTVGTSIGIALFPNDALDRETLLSHADAALYEAKMQGRGLYCVFEPSMGEHLRDRRQFEHDIRHAISRGELRLVYQPQAELLSNEVFGFEALLRWDHPERGAVPPGVFIPIAEECGAILKIGEWVLRTACAEAANWQQPLAISVNVSAMQLHGGNLPELVGAVLTETGLDASRLELEITETCLIKDIARALAALRQLKSLGVQIAMDDFGTGYSSLSNLRAFPFDKIKVDQSLVRAVDTSDEAAAVMRAVFGLARGLKLPVLAEGVETDAELTFLRQEACDAMQGYLLGRPCPISDFAQLTSGKGRTAAPDGWATTNCAWSRTARPSAQADRTFVMILASVRRWCSVPQVNRSYAEIAAHCSSSVRPARPRSAHRYRVTFRRPFSRCNKTLALTPDMRVVAGLVEDGAWRDIGGLRQDMALILRCQPAALIIAAKRTRERTCKTVCSHCRRSAHRSALAELLTPAVEAGPVRIGAGAHFAGDA